MITMKFTTSTSRVLSEGSFQKAVDLTLDELIALAKFMFGASYSTWNNKPEFKIEKGKNFAEIYTENDIYRYLNDGTKPHVITPREEGTKLVFYRDTFMPKTKVRDIYSGAGQRATKNKFVGDYVIHPGNEAREWDEVIVEECQKKVREIFHQQLNSVR